MVVSQSLPSGRTYHNPVFAHPFPDPFVLKFCGEYWGYCTGFWPDGRCFGVIRSRDLIHWQEIGGAFEPLPGNHTCYWAPEVVYENGRFLMYYSVGNEERMHIRVAVAEHPAGPFIDSGRQLTTEEFAIDPHVFADTDGTRYLFYATDFLEHTHIGTGTVCDRMVDAFMLEGQPRPVTRARYDWQVYDPQRVAKGGIRWHTVEGPFVLKRKELYYQMFSGGNWQNISYGVSYAVTDDIATAEEWEQVSDGEHVLPILRTIPGLVIGPGHNSVVRGPDNLELYCIYHRWAEDGSGRLLSIDPLDWAGERMLVIGPSVGPRPAPLAPAFAGFSTDDAREGLGQHWECDAGARWVVRDGAAVQESAEVHAAARCLVSVPCFVAELSLRALDNKSEAGGYGIGLYGESGIALRFMLFTEREGAVISWMEETEQREQQIALPRSFVPEAYHLLRIEVDHSLVTITLDEVALRWQGRIKDWPMSVALLTEKRAAAFAGFSLTVGWQDLFMQDGTDPAEHGWLADEDGAGWSIAGRQLWHRDATKSDSLIMKGPLLESYELTVNACLGSEAGASGGYGFYPALGAHERGPLLTVERGDVGWVMRYNWANGAQVFPLPAHFNPHVYHQFRFRKQEGRLGIQLEAEVLGEVLCPEEAARVGLYAHRAVAAFEMVRVTAMMENAIERYSNSQSSARKAFTVETQRGRRESVASM